MKRRTRAPLTTAHEALLHFAEKVRGRGHRYGPSWLYIIRAAPIAERPALLAQALASHPRASADTKGKWAQAAAGVKGDAKR